MAKLTHKFNFTIGVTSYLDIRITSLQKESHKYEKKERERDRERERERETDRERGTEIDR